MYQLLVYYPDTKGVAATIDARRAVDALELIPKILSDHEGCEHVVVMFNSVRLFAVDCAGNRLP